MFKRSRDIWIENSSTYCIANNIRIVAHQGENGRERGSKEKLDKRRKNETREEHQDSRTTEAIVFHGNLQNVSFHRGPYKPNWFVIPFYQRPSAGRKGAARGLKRECRGMYCVESRENAFAYVQMGSYRI